MRIIIETDGTSEGTVVKFSDEVQKDLTELNFSVRAGGKCKMTLVRYDEKTKRSQPQSFFGGDFEKFGNGPQTKESLIGQKVNNKEG